MCPHFSTLGAPVRLCSGQKKSRMMSCFLSRALWSFLSATVIGLKNEWTAFFFQSSGPHKEPIYAFDQQDVCQSVQLAKIGSLCHTVDRAAFEMIFFQSMILGAFKNALHSGSSAKAGAFDEGSIYLIKRKLWNSLKLEPALMTHGRLELNFAW